MTKKALITGITGQDGSYLAELLLQKGYEVHGIKRRSSSFNTQRIDHLYQDLHLENVKLKLHYGDLSDSTNIIRLIQEIQPDEIYNLGAMSHVRVSFDEPEYTANVDGLGALRILEAVRLLGLEEKTKIYQASTSELYGLVQEIPQKETTPFYPRSPYAVAKLYAYWITVNYREAYSMFACNGILFNHESPRRGETFLTRKVTMAVAAIFCGKQKELFLGNLSAQRDWGHAKDYVEAMWKILQMEKPEDYVIATSKTTSVRDFVLEAFSFLGMDLNFRGEGADEVGILININENRVHSVCASLGIDVTAAMIYELYKLLNQEIVKVDPVYFRPTEVDSLIGDFGKAKKMLEWEPQYTLQEMIAEMVSSDLKALV